MIILRVSKDYTFKDDTNSEIIEQEISNWNSVGFEVEIIDDNVQL